MFVAKTWVKIELVVVDSSSAVFMLCFFFVEQQAVVDVMRSTCYRDHHTKKLVVQYVVLGLNGRSQYSIVVLELLCTTYAWQNGMVEWQEPDPILELHVCGKKEGKIKDPLQYIYKYYSSRQKYIKE